MSAYSRPPSPPLPTSLAVELQYCLSVSPRPFDIGLCSIDGWSQLDIAKHACSTYIQALRDPDFLSIVVYSNSARRHIGWTSCSPDGKKMLQRAVKQLQAEGTTNLRDGIALGIASFDDLTAVVCETEQQEYARMLVVLTDGMPTSSFTPRGGYVDFVSGLLDETRTRNSRPILASIGLGNTLDSDLLTSYSDFFLHIPDPGSVGPFMVNLLANTQSMAKIVPRGDPQAATNTTIVLEPARLVRSVPGYSVRLDDGKAFVNMGSLNYDQPRHLLILQHVSAGAALRATFKVCDVPIATEVAVEADDAAFMNDLHREVERAAAVCCLQICNGTASFPNPIHSILPNWDDTEMMNHLVGLLGDTPLRATLKDQGLLALEQDKRSVWGRHYLHTLPQMLRSERRSNFRDTCLACFGHDAAGRQALFERMSNAAELIFAALPPPEPSIRRNGHRPTYSCMPDEFMRGGGCFGPHSIVQVLKNEQVEERTVDSVFSGDYLKVADGGYARVMCVVVHQYTAPGVRLMCVGSLAITDWHPVYQRNSWHFPAVAGTPMDEHVHTVYNFVLARNHILLVNGIFAVTLGHGLCAPVARHFFWGTGAVIEQLRARDGWKDGRVVITSDAPLQVCTTTAVDSVKA